MPDDALYKVAYDEAVRVLSEQQAAIESVRGRAGLLLSAAAVTTSFLGSQAMQRSDPGVCFWLALLCFVAVAATSLAILWPRDWEFAADPRVVVNSLYRVCGRSPNRRPLSRSLLPYVWQLL